MKDSPVEKLYVLATCLLMFCTYTIRLLEIGWFLPFSAIAHDALSPTSERFLLGVP